MKIKWWKVQREVKRLAFQIRDLPKTLCSVPEHLMRSRNLKKYEASFDKLTNISDGAIAASGKYAIFLIYQPDGVPASLWYTLDYVQKSGYAILAVLNTKVNESDLQNLKNVSWKVLERPNFGYDFGGYRDGLRILSQHVSDLESLIIMNDSVWFPTQGDPISIMERQIADQSYDAVGLNQDQKVRYQDDGSQTYELRNIESYFYMFSPSFIKSKDFTTFWRTYKMSSDKSYTIKNGEIGFSRYVMERGAKFNGLLKRQAFIEAMESATPKELFEALDYAVYADESHAKENKILVDSYDASAEWASKAYLHIRAVASHRPFNTSFPLAADRLFGTPYIKKNSQAFFHRMRMQILRGVDNGLIAQPPIEIMNEFRAMVEDYERNPPKNAEKTL